MGVEETGKVIGGWTPLAERSAGPSGDIMADDGPKTERVVSNAREPRTGLNAYTNGPDARSSVAGTVEGPSRETIDLNSIAIYLAREKVRL